MKEPACVSVTGYTVQCFCKGESPLINYLITHCHLILSLLTRSCINSVTHSVHVKFLKPYSATAFRAGGIIIDDVTRYEDYLIVSLRHFSGLA